MKTKADIHENPDWRTIGAFQYNVAAPSGLIWHTLAAKKYSAPVHSAFHRFSDGACGVAFFEMYLVGRLGRQFNRKITHPHYSERNHLRDLNKLASDLAAGGW